LSTHRSDVKIWLVPVISFTININLINININHYKYWSIDHSIVDHSSTKVIIFIWFLELPYIWSVPMNPKLSRSYWVTSGTVNSISLNGWSQVSLCYCLLRGPPAYRPNAQFFKVLIISVKRKSIINSVSVLWNENQSVLWLTIIFHILNKFLHCIQDNNKIRCIIFLKLKKVNDFFLQFFFHIVLTWVQSQHKFTFRILFRKCFYLVFL
jgi:hypothetical protein